MNVYLASNLNRVMGLALLGLGLCGCAHSEPKPPEKETPYARVLASDIRGKTIAEYIAEGKVTKTENGTKFRAVERRLEHPHRMVIHYPLGREVTVKAPNLLIEPASKPQWLHQLECR